MNLSNRKAFIILAVLLLFILVVNIITFKPDHNWNNSDFAGYILCAKSIVDGTVNELVQFNKFLSDNSTKDTGVIISKWGFPLLLSPVYYFWGLDIYAMKIFVSLFFLLSLWMVFLLFRDRLSNIENLLLVAVLAFNTWFFDFKENILSDIPFLFFSLMCLYVIKRFIMLKKPFVNNLFSYSLIGVLIFISYNIRPVGIILLPTLLIVQYFESRGSKTNKAILSDKINYVPYLIFIVFSAAFLLILPGAESNSVYFNKLSKLSAKWFIFDIKYYTVLPSRFFPFLKLSMNVYGFSYNKYSLILYGLMLVLTFLGIKKTYKKDYMFLIYMLITIPVVMLFSSRQGFRLLIPIFPFFLYFLFAGLSTITFSFELSNQYKPYKINAAPIFAIGLVLISCLYIATITYQTTFLDKTDTNKTCEASNENPYYDDGIELFNFVKANTDADDGIIFFKPRIMSLYANRKSCALSRWKFKFEQLLNSPAQYIAYNKKDNSFKLTTQDLRKNFECAFENDTFILCSLMSHVNSSRHE